MKISRENRRDGPARATNRFVMKLLAALPLMLAACAAEFHRVDNIDRGRIAQAAAIKPVVLGRLHIRSTGGIALMPEQPGWSEETFKYAATVDLVRLSDASRYLAYVPDNGRFAWSLEPGTYVIDELDGYPRQLGLTFNYAFCLKTAFRIERPTGIVNLGEITIVFPSDPTERLLTPGFFGDRCGDPENQIDVTQRAGEMTKLVLHPLTPVVIAPELPELWDAEAGSINQSKIPEARAVLERHGLDDFH